MKGIARALRKAGPALACTTLLACEVPFEPFEETGRVSVFGALDAAADTQWIRITPLRYTLLTSADPIATTVTLARQGDGAIVELRDSLIAFETGGTLTPKAVWFTHNFWTTEPIESGTTYTVTVTDPDRPTVVSAVPVPEDYPVTMGYPTTGTAATLRTANVEHLGPVVGRLHYDPDCAAGMGLDASFFQIYFPAPPPLAAGVHEVRVFPFTRDDSRLLPCPVVERDLFVVASGSPWPKSLQSATSALGVPNAPANVENGVGFLAGVRTTVIPWEPCALEPRVGPCVLTYDSMSVTLRGTVRDGLTRKPLPGADLRLTEIVPDSLPPTRLRGPTDDQGAFQIGALEPGVSHVLRVSHPAHCWDNDLAPLVFTDHVDTLPAYAPAERATWQDVVLPRNPDPICADYEFPLK